MRKTAAVLAFAALIAGPTGAQAQTFTDEAATVLGGVNVSSRSGSFADIDGDGDLDLLIQTTGSSSRLLMRNDLIPGGTLAFTNISGNLDTADFDPGNGWSAAWGDYDGDYDLDVFLGNTNSGDTGDLLQNDGTGVFTDVSPSTIPDPGFAQCVAWSDIDNDQDLDLLIAMEGPEEHEIYLQGPAGTFTPVGASVGFQVPFGTKAYGLAIGDTDGDGDMDVYMSTCRSGGNIRNNFFENQLIETGSLSFIDIADSNGTQNLDNSYGSEFHDFDNDGDLDLFMTGADREKCKIWRNDGNNMFTDVDTITGHDLISDVAGDLNGSRAVDYDNDGDLDLYFHDHLIAAGRNNARKLYRNDGNWEFTDVTLVSGLSASNEDGYDSAWGDVDLDGDMDLLFPNFGSFPERLFINDADSNGNGWLQVRLVGPAWNTSAIGARVSATILDGSLAGTTLWREANTNAGTFNQSALPVHFGLGDATQVDLRVYWPGGTQGTLYGVSANQYLTLDVLTVPAGLTFLGTAP